MNEGTIGGALLKGLVTPQQRVRVTQEDEFAQNATVFTGAG